jgi:hypothetical protein
MRWLTFRMRTAGTACFRGLWTDRIDGDLGIEKKRKPLVNGEDGIEALRTADEPQLVCGEEDRRRASGASSSRRRRPKVVWAEGRWH